MSGEDERARRLARLLKVQNQKRSVEEWRLAHLRDERARIEALDVEIVESLNHEGALHGLFLDSKVRALRRNDGERRRNAAEQVKAEARLVAARRLEKGVEKAHGRARADARTEGARRELDETLERVANSAVQSRVRERYGPSSLE